MIQHLERVRYFSGRLLSVEDFQDEQSYWLNRLRRINRHGRGWGVVEGLGVGLSDGGDVVIDPGLAIDCAGNELVVAEPMRMPIGCSEGPLWVAICYREQGVKPVPSGNGVESSRIREAVELTLLPINPGTGHRGIGPGTPGCDLAHPLCLARLEWRRSRWQIRSVRNRS